VSVPGGSPDGSAPQGIGAAITEVSERATLLIREEIELAKTEIAEKTARLARGAAVGAAAGVFLMAALVFILVGCAWLLYYELPIGNQFTYFWGFFIMAGILIVLAALAGFAAARAVRSSAPPVPEMAIEQARKIRETVAAGSQEDKPAHGASTPHGGSAPVAAPSGAPSSSIPSTEESDAHTLSR
jgi:hypothetical protein